MKKNRYYEDDETSLPDDYGRRPGVATDEFTGPTEFNLDPFAGAFPWEGKEIFELDDVVNQIDSGRSTDVSDGVITYGFFVGNHAVGLNNNPSFGEGKGYSPFTEAQKAATIEAAGYWDDLIPQSFVNVGDVEVKDWAQGTADIILANTTTGPGQAWAYFPGYGNQYERVSSDVWTADPNVNITNLWFTPGGYGNTTLIHELGHSVGLSHPGDYNGPGATNYADQAEYAQDSEQYTIMSYWGNENTHPLGVPMLNPATLQYLYAQTPMLHDIVTIQAKYGADPTTRVDDTTYGFNSNTGKWVYDFSENPYPYLAIYDAGGNDTIDASGFTKSGQYIDLNDGAFSSIGDGMPTAAEFADARSELADALGIPLSTDLTPGRMAIIQSYIDANTLTIELVHGVSGIETVNYDNVAIAYGTMIENAIGGQQRDVLIGNELGNMLDGQAGDDVIIGNDGDDIIIGGLGADEMTGGNGSDTFVFEGLEMGDLITDFASDDFIDLSALGADGDLSFIGDADFSSTAGEVRYKDGLLQADVDGDGNADFQVTLDGMPELMPDQLVLMDG